MHFIHSHRRHFEEVHVSLRIHSQTTWIRLREATTRIVRPTFSSWQISVWLKATLSMLRSILRRGTIKANKATSCEIEGDLDRLRVCVYRALTGCNPCSNSSSEMETPSLQLAIVVNLWSSEATPLHLHNKSKSKKQI